jgi:tetratricopeptide (TPR) repeat protein
LVLLARRWDSVRAGEGQLVLIVGEPGLGKSRLIDEFHSQLAETAHTWVEWGASQLLQNTALHPIAEWGRLRFSADAPPDQRLADLEGTLRSIGLDPAEHTPLLAPLVDIPLPTNRVPNFVPEELRRRQLAAMTGWVLAGARSQPVVLAFEDLQWADPTSLDLLRALADRGGQAPLFLIATSRPEFRPPWGMRSHHSAISLAPLKRAQVYQMVGDLASLHALSKDVVEGVTERTGGVPLFIEEVTRLLLERGEQGGVQAIPPTLQQSLAARLDRLGSAREVAQIGSVLGREFAYALLRNIAEIDEPVLQASFDQLADADLLFVEGEPPQANYRFKHALIQDAAYDSLLKSRRQALHRRAAEALSDQPERAEAASEVVAHHFTEAGLDDLAIEWWGKAGDQALRRSAFREAVAHLGKAIEMADKTGRGTSAAVSASASVNQRLKLQTSLGRALLYSRGFGADEPKAAFIRARELAVAIDNPTERLNIYHGLWIGNLLRGELGLAREIAETFLREAERGPGTTEYGDGCRFVGLTCLFQGDFVEAQAKLLEALSTYDPERDQEARFRFGTDYGAAARAYLAITKWLLGEVGPARALIEGAVAHAIDTGHVPTLANTYLMKAHLDMIRGDAAAAQHASEIVVKLSRENALTLYAGLGAVQSAWANARLDGSETWATDLRQALGAYIGEGNRTLAPFSQGLLAEIEAEGDAAGALTRIDEALGLARDAGEHWSDAFLYRLRGEILLRRDPADPASAEDSYRTALEIAKRQGARSPLLLASLALAKLYQTTDRLVEAHATLAPALEGFSPTPEMPEIAEAHRLLAALAETDEVKAAEAQRERRLHLQLGYSRAMMWSKGFADDETLAAYTRARDLAGEGGADEDRYSIYYGHWLGLATSGKLQQARATAEAFLADATAADKRMETAVAHRTLALNCFLLGAFAEARSHADRAIELDDPARTAECRFRFGVDCRICALGYLALATWQIGEVDEAIRLSQEALTQATASGHVQTLANTGHFMAALDAARGDAEAADRTASMVFALSREHDMKLYIAWSEMPLLWARSRLGDHAAEVSRLRQSVANYMAGGHRGFAPFYSGLLAELDAGGPDANDAPTQIDAAIALAQKTGERWADSMLHRIRGEILLRREQTNPARAEEAFRTALAIATEQGARSWGLRAALSLAKLYQSTARPADAHAVLASALEGFAPTLEMPEIAEAQALLGAIDASEHARPE